MSFAKLLSKRIEPKPRRFIKETDYDRFLSDLANTYNIYVSKDTIIRLSHFICNSVEDGRIERLRSQKASRIPRTTLCSAGDVTGKEEKYLRRWPTTPIRYGPHILLVLNQVLTLATMGIYQKRVRRLSG